MTSAGLFRVPLPFNEPVRSYETGSPERTSWQARLAELAGTRVEMPLVVGGRDMTTGRTFQAVMPHRTAHVLGTVHWAGTREMEQAVEAARRAWPEWSRLPWTERAAVFLRAADLLAGPWRDRVNAATMLGQSKTAHQAESDAAAELIDFWRCSPWFAARLEDEQPVSPPGSWNRLEYRPLEGFVFAATPFNFTSIAGNLPHAPALMGNTVVWKPASTAIFSAHVIMDVLEAAGLPPGVINMVPGPGATIGDPVLASSHLAGIHFTGSTGTFQAMWETVGRNIRRYRAYPRVVGETGGKDFVFAHVSADVDALATALVRGAFEYQGQKCSAASRAYIPASLWPRVQESLLAQVAEIRVGDVVDFTNFMGAVIDEHAFDSIRGYLDGVRNSRDARILAGGGADGRVGWFIEPTVVQVSRPDLPVMREEIFGPVLSVYVYEDAELDTTLMLCDQGSPYALTGAVFATDRAAIAKMSAALRDAQVNSYITD